MPGSVLWFILMLLTLPLAWMTGLRASAIRDPWRRGWVVGLVFGMLLGWVALIQHPAVAVQIIPLFALARLEGVAAAPLFVFVLAVGWKLGPMRRQRAVMIAGMLLGAVYFFQGSSWMMRPTPSHAFGHGGDRYFVSQSQDYSCVPAACTTSLRMLGVQTNEAEMAQLTETRPGSGATLLRALNGLDDRLHGTNIEPVLLQPSYDDLQRLEPPLLTPLQFKPGQLHMVTVVEVRPHLVVIADPQVGIEFMSRGTFLDHYRGQVIAFSGGGARATTAQLLAQHPLMTDPDITLQASPADAVLQAVVDAP